LTMNARKKGKPGHPNPRKGKTGFPSPYKNVPNFSGNWSKEDVAYLRTHYETQGTVAVAAALGKTPDQVRSKANRIGVRLTREATARIVHAKAKEYMTANNPMHREEVREKVRAWLNTTPEGQAIKDKFFAGKCQAMKDKPSGLERMLHQILSGIGVEFESSVAIKRNFVVDVKIGRLIIQADGDYWHGHPRFNPLSERQVNQQKRDKAQDAYLRKCGYAVERIWESDMSEATVRAVLKRNGVSSAYLNC
jgi:G:T-mismatch repair DNA endonuclease (very short patch repair protein)